MGSLQWFKESVNDFQWWIKGSGGFQKWPNIFNIFFVNKLFEVSKRKSRWVFCYPLGIFRFCHILVFYIGTQHYAVLQPIMTSTWHHPQRSPPYYR